MYINKKIGLGLLFCAAVLSCKKSVTQVKEVYFYQPSHFPAPNYVPPSGVEGEELFKIGRELFYDPILSSDNSVSCGDCHKAIAAFGDPGHRVSHGVNGALGTRNSPPLFNLAWKSSFMKDGGINHIEVQAIAPIENPVEMNLPIWEALQKLKNNAHYRNRFYDLYGDTLQSAHFLKAIATFMSGMISANAKYDQVIQGFDAFTASETRGAELFEAHCATCHSGPLFTNNAFLSNGFMTDDAGRMVITGSQEDSGRFVVPSLRNLAYSKPYFHDGSVNSLSEVLDHYQSTTNLKDLKSNIILTEQERTDLLAFLNTLNDPYFINNQNLQP